MTTVSARNNKARGKQDERDVARIIGGKRHPADSGGHEDIEHSELAIQVKGGGTCVTEIMRVGMASAKAAGAVSGKLPALVLVDRRGTRLQRYIVFDLAQWCDYHGYGPCPTCNGTGRVLIEQHVTDLVQSEHYGPCPACGGAK